ncbi:hypothetical protein [Nocardioides bigeumensis]|uniref:Uncharacterized protein n=1 Tax=Nocardioides bigeumensis TaxID=433657 RepID=A0ABN2Y105_9ACTN
MSTYSHQSGDQRTGGWHTVNVGHLVMGLAFLGLAAVWAAVQLDVVPDDDVRWLLPLPWVFAGAAGLIASVVASGQRWRRSKQPTTSYAGASGGGFAETTASEAPDYTSDLDEKLAQHDPQHDPQHEPQTDTRTDTQTGPQTGSAPTETTEQIETEDDQR